MVQKLGGHVHRGDIVVFDPAGSLLLKSGSKQSSERRSSLDALAIRGGSRFWMVKRVVGVEGDTVACDAPGAAMTVNGRPITSRSAGSEQACIDAFSVTVTKNAVWVLGDNFNHSLDSRNGLHFGSPFIPLSSVLGKVRAIAWPLNRWQRL